MPLWGSKQNIQVDAVKGNESHKSTAEPNGAQFRHPRLTNRGSIRLNAVLSFYAKQSITLSAFTMCKQLALNDAGVKSSSSPCEMISLIFAYRHASAFPKVLDIIVFEVNELNTKFYIYIWLDR